MTNDVNYDALVGRFNSLNKFGGEEELETMFDKWMFVLRNLSRLLERPASLQDRVFKKLFEQAEIAKYTNAERQQYEASLKEYWDYTSTMETAFRKGEKEGRKEEKTETARKMRSMGFDAETIAKITGLTVEDVNMVGIVV